MGRAIDMEKDIEVLKAEVKKLDNIVRGMSASLNELEEKSTKTKHVDLVDDVKTKEEKKDGKKKANSKGNGKGDKPSDKSSGDTDSKAG
tara:strand:+ start:111 stop:377 length:267 start_codon:yes stop_codon:yes gene_type:complete